MIQRKRWRLSPAEKIDIWRRWKCGQSLHAIGRAYGRPHPTIRKLLLPSGGIPPLTRRRSRLALTLAEREDISRGIASGSTIREIASRLGRAASTVSREIAPWWPPGLSCPRCGSPSVGFGVAPEEMFCLPGTTSCGTSFASRLMLE
jgi:hypothetical protein